MNHLFDIFATLEQLPPNSEAVLATVVSVEGSAYRQPGARMLILADGQSIGMVSGGCLEKHLVQRAFWLTRHGATLKTCLLYKSPSPRDVEESRMPSSA